MVPYEKQGHAIPATTPRCNGSAERRFDDPLLAGRPALCHPVDCYRVKCKTGGSDLDAEAASEEKAALDSYLNDEPLPLEACPVTCARPIHLVTRRTAQVAM
jgi:hypothetical protein